MPVLGKPAPLFARLSWLVVALAELSVAPSSLAAPGPCGKVLQAFSEAESLIFELERNSALITNPVVRERALQAASRTKDLLEEEFKNYQILGDRFDPSKVVESGATLRTYKAAIRKPAAAGEAVPGQGKQGRQEGDVRNRKGTPRNNQVQNAQFNEAIKRVEKRLGRPLDESEFERAHDAVSHQGYDLQEMVEEIYDEIRK